MPAVDVGARLDQGQWTPYQRVLVAMVASTIVIDGIDNQLLAVSVPSIMRDWSVPRATFAPILAFGMLGMMLGGALAGVVGDRFGRKVALLGSVVVFGLLTFASAYSSGVTMLSALRFFAGIGLGGAMPNAAALSSEFVPLRHRAFAVTLTIVCVPLGGMLAALLAEYVLPSLGWRVLFMIGGLLPLALAALLTALLPESPRYLARHPARHAELATLMARFGHDLPSSSTFDDRSEKAVSRVSVVTLFEPMFRRDTIALAVALFSCLLAVYTCFNWVPSMLASAGLGAYSSRGILAFNLGGVVGAISGAWLISRLGSRVTMVGMALGAMAAALVMAATPIVTGSSIVTIIALLTVTGCLINAVQTTMFALGSHVYPTAVRATGVGTTVAIGRAGGVASTYAGEWAIAAGGSVWFFGLIAVAMGVAAAGLAMVRRHIPAR